MTPEVMDVVTKAINEVNLKVLAETREEAMTEGRYEADKQITKSLRNSIDLNELSEATGLTIEEIQNL